MPALESDSPEPYHALASSMPTLPPTPLRRLLVHSASSPALYKKKKRRRKHSAHLDYCIEYSVFRPLRDMLVISSAEDMLQHCALILQHEGQPSPETYMSHGDFQQVVSAITHDVEQNHDLRPQRISQGSSGSYFVFGLENGTVRKRGIFKPKDEEPYGPLLPKWTKWLHRTFFPCFFGRSCLIPNLGYISEAAACVLDRQLLTFIVPYTGIVSLKSPQFYYSFWESSPSPKIGSLQMFLSGYVEATYFFRMFPIPQNIDALPDNFPLSVHKDVSLADVRLEFRWTRQVLRQFQEQLEKLVILDYIMRNTDRGADNWMIKLEWREVATVGDLKLVAPFLRVGAIDSGLAFPWKHPDEWRSFPFGWLFLPYAIIGQPFSAKTRQHFLPLLTSKYWWEQTVTRLKKIFRKDADFKERMWHKQVAVLKGQAFNVVEILKLPYAGPLELTRRENLMIWDDLMDVPISLDTTIISNALESSIHEAEQRGSSETTPLLEPKSGKHPKAMLGFDYNVTYECEERHQDEEETNTRMVVIERLEKVEAKPPVFTWC